MNKLDRVRKTLQQKNTDRPPVSFWFHFPAEMAQGEASVQAHLEYYRNSGIDFLKVMNEHPYEANIDLKEPEDWLLLRPAPVTAPFYQSQLDELKQILDNIQQECMVITTVFNPFSSGNHASQHLLMEHLRINPQAVAQGLSCIAESLALFSLACLEIGAAGIYFSAQGGEAHRFCEEDFLRYIKPFDLTVLNEIDGKGEFNLLHICKENIRLPLYADYPSHAVNWAVTKNALSLKEGSSLFNRPILGGMDDRGIIVNGSPAEIRTAVQMVLDSAPAVGFMLGADCTIPTDISMDNICRVMEVVKERYGC